jgi:aminopeptidase N
MRAVALLACVLACSLPAAGADDRDHHSNANPEHVRVRHVDMELDVRFDDRVIRGDVVLTVERTSADRNRPLVLDTNGLRVASVEASADGRTYARTPRRRSRSAGRTRYSVRP